MAPNASLTVSATVDGLKFPNSVDATMASGAGGKETPVAARTEKSRLTAGRLRGNGPPVNIYSHYLTLLYASLTPVRTLSVSPQEPPHPNNTARHKNGTSTPFP